jgi:hypothetical protein
MVFALLADNELVALTIADGVVRAQYRVGATPASDDLRYTGHYMALSNDRRRLFVLAPGAPGRADRVAVVDVGTSKLLASYMIGDVGGIFHALAVGPSTGRIYLFGDRSGDAVVTVLNAESGADPAHWIARKADGYNWWPYEGAVSDDEQALYIRYHGMDTTGVDRFMILADGLQRCPPPKRANDGCIVGHGGFRLYGDAIVTGTGEGMLLLENVTGTIQSAYDTGLGGHQMEFVVDSPTSRLYTVKSCGYSGGVSTVNLTAGGTYTLTKYGEIKWLLTPAPPENLAAPQPGTPFVTVPCGERLAPSPDSWLVVGKTARPVPNVGNPGALTILDAFTAKVLRSFATPSESMDVLVVATE